MRKNTVPSGCVPLDHPTASTESGPDSNVISKMCTGSMKHNLAKIYRLLVGQRMKPQENVSFSLKTLFLVQTVSEKLFFYLLLKKNPVFLQETKVCFGVFCTWHNNSSQKALE